MLEDKYRMIRTLTSAVQAGLAAGVAWAIARWLLPSDTPSYAPIAAVAVIGAGFDRRIDRGLEMLKGMALAAVLSQTIIIFFGTGPVLIGVAAALTVVVARLLFDGSLVVVYAALNSAILVALGGDGWFPDRIVEAVIGASAAYAIVYLLLPPRPSAHVNEALREQIRLATDNLALAADTLRAADSEQAVEVERRSEEIDRNVGALIDTFDFSREVSRLSPWRRGDRPVTEQMRERARQLQSILRDATTLVRLASKLAPTDQAQNRQLAASIDQIRGALESIPVSNGQSRPPRGEPWSGRRVEGLVPVLHGNSEPTESSFHQVASKLLVDIGSDLENWFAESRDDS